MVWLWDVDETLGWGGRGRDYPSHSHIKSLCAGSVCDELAGVGWGSRGCQWLFTQTFPQESSCSFFEAVRVCVFSVGGDFGEEGGGTLNKGECCLDE